MRRLLLCAVVTIAALASTGCAVAGLTGGAAAVAALQASTGAAIRAGTEYSLTGSAYRTFVQPLDEVASGVRTTLQRMAMPVQRDEEGEDDRRELVATARDRRIEITLTPLTPATTVLKLVVKRGFLGRDRATASEIIAQTERALAPAEAALLRSPGHPVAEVRKGGRGTIDGATDGTTRYARRAQPARRSDAGRSARSRRADGCHCSPTAAGRPGSTGCR